MYQYHAQRQAFKVWSMLQLVAQPHLSNARPDLITRRSTGACKVHLLQLYRLQSIAGCCIAGVVQQPLGGLALHLLMELWRCRQQGLCPKPPLVHAHLQLLDQLLRPSRPSQPDASALPRPNTGLLLISSCSRLPPFPLCRALCLRLAYTGGRS